MLKKRKIIQKTKRIKHKELRIFFENDDNNHL